MAVDQKEKTADTQLDNLNKQKQDLEKQINDLKGQVLDTKEKQDELAKLESEKKKVEEELVKHSQSQETKLEKDIAIPSQTYELIKGTQMHSKLLNVLKTEVEVKKFSDDIDATVKSYLNQAFKESSESTTTIVSQEVISSMNIGIQFAMMETLTASGNQWSDFFNGFSKVNTGDWKSAFTWLFELFSKFGNKVWWGSKFLQLAKRVQNCSEFIKIQIKKEPQYWDGSKSKQLNNANEFRKILSNTARDNNETLRQKKLQDMGITVSDKELTPAEKIEGIQDLKKIADNPNMPIDEKTIVSIQKALPNAQKFLEKRGEYKNKAVEIMDKVWSILDINLFGLWTIGSLLWFNSPSDLLWKKWKKKWIIDFILRIMWFSWWVEGLHREYVYQNIEKNLHEHPDKDNKEKFIKDAMKKYMTSSEQSYSWTDILAKFNLEDHPYKSKLPTQYDTIKKNILDAISWKETSLDPKILQSLWVNVPTKILKDKDQKDIVVIDETKFDKSQINDSFMTSYLDKQIPYLASNKDFMTEIKDADQFVLALTGNLVADKYFVEWVLLGLENSENYLWSTTNTTSNTTTPGESSNNPGEAYTWEIKKETLEYKNIVDVVIDKIEWWYYHPNMNIAGMWSSWETMMWIDRKNWGNLNTSEAWKEFWKIIDEDRSKNPTLRTHNYRWGALESKLRGLAWDIIKPHYENLSTTYLSKESLNIINTDWRLKFNFVYWARNGAWRFEKMANVINAKLSSWTTNTDDLLKLVIDRRKNESWSNLIAQWWRKIEDIVWLT